VEKEYFCAPHPVGLTALTTGNDCLNDVVSAMLPAMDDAGAVCDAGITSSHQRYYDSNNQPNQLLQLVHSQAAVCSGWATSLAEFQPHGAINRRRRCSQRPKTSHTLTAADSTTAGPTSSDDALLTRPDVRRFSVLTVHVKFQVRRGPCYDAIW